LERNPASIRTATIFYHLCFFLLIATFLLTSFASPVFATQRTGQNQMNETGTRYVYPVGKTVGIKLFSDGVLVIGTSDIKTQNGDISPAKACGLQEGDIITHINSKEVNSIEDVQEIVQQTAGGALDMQILRDNTESNLTTKATQCSTDGAYKLGAWIRDSMAGIGTMTFYDPEENIFGTLGHGINDIDTSQLMPLESGAIMPSSVANVSKGLSGSPGQLHGSFEIERDLGALYANTNGGVFGSLNNMDILEDTALVPLAKKQ
jgi:stage IV sporulation protein B